MVMDRCDEATLETLSNSKIIVRKLDPHADLGRSNEPRDAYPCPDASGEEARVD
jgi:hypothetical protein